MNIETKAALICLLLAALGASSMLASRITRLAGGALPHAWLMTFGASLLAAAAALLLVVAGTPASAPLRPLMP